MDYIKKYTQANRLAWNEVMPIHQQSNSSKWDDAFSDPGFVMLDKLELEQLEYIGVSGKSIAHLCCNNGVELMSLKNLGAGKCVGFDISELAVKEAQDRAEKTGVQCEFVCCDIYDIADPYYETFDMVYITVGCLGWMPDLKLFFKKATKLLKKTGVIFIYELHPVSEMLSSDSNKDEDPLKIIEPYFKVEPYEENAGLDYIGKSNYEAKTQYWFVWTLSDIFMATIESGLEISRFFEYSHDISASHSKNQHAGIEIPLSFILVASKS